MPSRSEDLRDDARRRLIHAARSALAFTGEVTPNLARDICEQTGVHPGAFRSFFPTDDELLNDVTASLVEECATRLRAGVDSFDPSGDPDEDLRAAALALGTARPLDRGGMIIRAHRRLLALRIPGSSAAVADAERLFLGALVQTLVDLIAKAGRRFEWPAGLAARVIVDTYERSFEAWMLAGHDEHRFFESSYIQRTLPMLFTQLSVPLAVGSHVGN